MKKLLEKHGILITLIPVLLVMAVIFFFSAQNGETSGGLSRKITGWILETVVTDFEQLSAAQQELLYSRVGLVIRKLGHFSEFAALGFFLLLHMEQIKRRTPVALPRLLTWGLGTAYAVSDELHQHFVGGRTPAFTDVLIDSFGVLAGLLLMNMLLRRIRRNRAS